MDPVEEIKRRLNASEVVGSYVQLKPAGRNHKGLCPFHHEKTPSFMVSDEKGIWHCFGCGEGGDIFGFVMKMEGLEFRPALENLARRAGVTLEDNRRSGASSEIKNRLYRVLEMATRYYEAALERSPKAKAYLKKRGLSDSTIKSFRLGYAPGVGDSLVKFLNRQKLKPEDLTKAGLVRQSPGKPLDLFRDRLIIPFVESQGKVIGFTGRVFDAGMPKYLNSPQTLLFDKSRFLFGLNLAKDAIRETDEAVVVEGNLDVMASHQAGVKQVVASSGTALTLPQLKQLGRFSRNLKLGFDSDAAGIVATERTIPLAQSIGLALFIVELEGVKDPDELLKQSGGKERWSEAIKNAPYVMDWLLKKLSEEYDLSSALGKKQLTDRLMQTLAKLTDAVEQDHYIQKVAALVGASAQIIRKKLSASKPEAAPQRHIEAAYRSSQIRDEHSVVEEALLALCLSYADTHPALQDVKAEFFSTPERQQIAAYLKHHAGASVTKKLPKELANLDNYIKILLLKGEQGYQSWAALDRRIEAFGLAARLNQLQLKKQRQKLNDEIRAAEKGGDNKRKLELLREFRDSSHRH